MVPVSLECAVSFLQVDARELLTPPGGHEPVRCGICGSEDFGPGPGGRLSATGTPPACRRCGSLERHRIIREVWDCFPVGFLRWQRVLQFSEDPSVEAGWFLEYEVSDFEEENSLDLQAIDRPDDSYDIVICNHVFEHVPHDAPAFSETLRILKPDGLLQFSVPNPKARAVTEDWGFPKPEQWGHYRVYGRDIVDRISQAVPGVHLLSIDVKDGVTLVEDFVYFASSDADIIESVGKMFGGAGSSI